VVLALAAALVTPLAGLFLALAAFAWFLADLPRSNLWAAAIVIASLAPLAVLELLFPGQGRMPFAPLDFVATLVPLAALAFLLERGQRTLRIGFALYALLTVGAYVIPTALGVNATRLTTSVGLGLAVCLPARSRRARLLLVAALVPLALSQWMPARGPLLGWSNPATSATYFKPLLDYLVPRDHPLARVEVVPLSTHWESDYVALRLPLARGWERQLDTADNPIFYDPGRLSAASYRAWLGRNGVRFVALASAPLDYAGVGEARLLRLGVPGLRLVWRDTDWRVFELARAPAIVSGAGALVSESGARLVLSARRAGVLQVRVRGGSRWAVTSGAAVAHAGADGWLSVAARRGGRIALEISP
jgi:hypothetical protein